MSSHREAPTISKDPVADNTDTYAFVSPTDPSKVTILTSYLPGEAPNGGPNFYEFGDDVLYSIHIDNTGDGNPDITYEFRFTTEVRAASFLYNTGPITSIGDTTWNRPQYYSVTRVTRSSSGNSKDKGNGKSNGRVKETRTVLADRVPCPPCNVGPRSTPNYAALAAEAVTALGTTTVFAGQRADSFYVDLGSIFDLGTLRPFQAAHAFGKFGSDEGVDALATSNVHTIAIEIPIAELTVDGSQPSDVEDPAATIGVWGAASRQRGLTHAKGKRTAIGPWEQVSRLGNPLFNEVLVPMADKDGWNASTPAGDAEYVPNVARPELAALLPGLYPGVFPNLGGYDSDRVDLLAVLLFGIPSGVVAGFQNVIGSKDLDEVLGGGVTPADMLRLNVAVAPTQGARNRLGLVGGDADGFPNGRRLEDDVTTIELRAIAGLTIPLVDPTYTPDGAASAIEDGTYENPGRTFLPEFPFIGTPYSGYYVGTETPDA